jgi:hypothetical protein
MNQNIQLSLTANDDFDAALRHLLSDIFTSFSVKRYQLAEELSNRAGRRISCSMLNAFAAPSNETARFPAALIVHLCDITGDDRLQRFVMGPRLRKLVEFAERELHGCRDQREREALRESLLQEFPYAHSGKSKGQS